MAYRGKITEDDSPGPGQFWLMTSWNGLGPAKSHLIFLDLVILVNLEKGSDETSCLRTSSWDKQFRLVLSRNWPGPGKSSTVI